MYCLYSTVYNINIMLLNDIAINSVLTRDMFACGNLKGQYHEKSFQTETVGV